MLGAIVCFYASARHGSEYRSGLDFIEMAWREGFELAVISDIEQNDAAAELEGRFPGLKVIVVPSPARKQRLLYRYTDVAPQIVWHRRVAKTLRCHRPELERLWINNGAQPWLPLKSYDRCFKRQLVWGPVGGGAAPAGHLATFPASVRARERVRAWVVGAATVAKARYFAQVRRSGRIVRVMARTREAAASLKTAKIDGVAVVPEIIAPLQAAEIAKSPSDRVRFLWIGQDIPRKNLEMALAIFARLKDQHFPDLTMDVYGVDATSRRPIANVVFHGWTPAIPWQEYSAGAILLLTSYREGLPSVILEALSAGIPCVSTDVGSIGSLAQEPLFLIPMENYPEVDDRTLARIAVFIRRQAEARSYRLNGTDHTSAIARLIAMENERTC